MESEAQKTYRRSEPGKATRAKIEARRRKAKGRHYLWFVGTKYRAKEHGIPFTLEQMDVPWPARCPVFGTPFVHGTEMGPSLDKIVPEKGYVRGNVAVISRRANAMKSDCTDPREAAAIATYIADHMSLGDLVAMAQEF